MVCLGNKRAEEDIVTALEPRKNHSSIFSRDSVGCPRRRGGNSKGANSLHLPKFVVNVLKIAIARSKKVKSFATTTINMGVLSRANSAVRSLHGILMRTIKTLPKNTATIASLSPFKFMIRRRLRIVVHKENVIFIDLGWNPSIPI
jgi:hypothetical protein